MGRKQRKKRTEMEEMVGHRDTRDREEGFVVSAATVSKGTYHFYDFRPPPPTFLQKTSEPAPVPLCWFPSPRTTGVDSSSLPSSTSPTWDLTAPPPHQNWNFLIRLVGPACARYLWGHIYHIIRTFGTPTHMSSGTFFSSGCIISPKILSVRDLTGVASGPLRPLASTGTSLLACKCKPEHPQKHNVGVWISTVPAPLVLNV